MCESINHSLHTVCVFSICEGICCHNLCVYVNITQCSSTAVSAWTEFHCVCGLLYRILPYLRTFPPAVRLTAWPTCSTVLPGSATPSEQATLSRMCSTSTQPGVRLASTARWPGQAHATMVHQFRDTLEIPLHAVLWWIHLTICVMCHQNSLIAVAMSLYQIIL